MCYDAKEQCAFVWENGRGVWNNSQSDPAELYDVGGKLVDRIKYYYCNHINRMFWT